MRLIKLPETQYTDYYDQSRFNLTWRINIFIFGTNLVLLPIMFFLSIDEFIGLAISSTLAAIYQVTLYKTRKYETIAVIWVVLGVISTSISLLTVPTLMHVTDLIFMFMCVAYAFFTLGKTAGILVTSGNIAAVSIYLCFVLKNDEMLVKEFTAIDISKTILISIYGAAITAYIFSEFLKLNKYAAENYQDANKQLEEVNELINKKNQEKTVMLREIHHRVKNNLQVITSLLRLQMANEQDDLVVAKFNEATRRVAAMSLIHEKIYQSEDIARLNFEEYLKSLSQDLIASYALKQEVKLEIKTDDLELSNQYFVSIALLCNELISNSLKHAFQPDQKGMIKVTFEQDGEGRYGLIYSDNGTWKESTGESTFGIELIDTLAEQLNGSYERVSDENGTTYVFDLNHLSG